MRATVAQKPRLFWDPEQPPDREPFYTYDGLFIDIKRKKPKELIIMMVKDITILGEYEMNRLFNRLQHELGRDD